MKEWINKEIYKVNKYMSRNKNTTNNMNRIIKQINELKKNIIKQKMDE